MEHLRLFTGDPEPERFGGSATLIATSGRGSTDPMHGSARRFRDHLSAPQSTTARRRVAVDHDSTVVAEVQGEYRGLRLPGPVVAPHP